MLANEIASFRSPRYSAVDAEPVYVDVNAEQRLDDSDEQDDHVIPPLEEAKAEAPDDECRDKREHGEAADVVSVRDVAAADRSRGEIMAQKAPDEEDNSEPRASLISQSLLTSSAGLGRRGLRLDLRRLHVRCRSRCASIRRDRVRRLRLLRGKVGNVAFAFVFHLALLCSARYSICAVQQ